MSRRIFFALFIVAFVPLVFCSPALPGKIPQRSWNLARDMALGNGNPVGCWFFMKNNYRDHKPLHINKLPKFFAVYEVNPRKAWNDPATGTYIGMAKGADTIWPAYIPVLRPMAASMAKMAPFAIVGWKSPLNGRVNISGLLTDIEPMMGNGVKWFIDVGSKTIAQGAIANGGQPQSFQLTNVTVSQGQMIYFIVDSKDCYHDDDTTLDVLITIASP